MSYRIDLRPSARRDLVKLPAQIQVHIADSMGRLSQAPRGPGTKPIKGKLQGLRRLRVREYRVVYVVDDKTKAVDVLRIGPRGSVY